MSNEITSSPVPEFPDVDVSPEIHQARLSSRNYFERNKEKLLPKQKEYKAQMRKDKPWVVKYDNAYQLARRGEYLPAGGLSKADKADIRSLYQTAYEVGGCVQMRVAKSQGGKFQLSNLEIGGAG